jgi:hypothetical protein
MATLTTDQLKAKYSNTPTSTTAPSGKLTTDELKAKYAQPSSSSQAPTSDTGAPFPAVPNENPATAALKTAGNLPSSALNFVKGAIDTVNPISTLGRLAQIPGVISDIFKQGNSAGTVAKNVPEGAYEATVPKFGRQLIAGDTTGAQKTVTEDPVGSIAPIFLAGRGVAGKLGYGDAIDSTVSKVGQTGANIVTAPIRVASDIVRKTAGFGARQATGLDTSTIGEITRNPEAFTREARASIDRSTLADEVKSGLDERIASKAETGKGYEPVRNLVATDEAGNVTPHTVSVDPNWLDRTIRNVTGLGIRGGRILAKGSSSIREARDINAIQQTYNLWRPIFAKGKLSTNEFLNFREDLSKLAGYDREVSKSGALENLSSIVRGKFNSVYRKQVPGLENLDESFAKQAKDLKVLRKGIIDKDGKLIPAAINRIANAANKGKDLELQRLEQIIPGISKKIRVLKAIEDIEKASENKVGTYARGILAGGSLITLNIPGIIATILSQPEVAVPLLRQYGFAKPVVAPVLAALKSAGNKVNNSPSTVLGAGSVQPTQQAPAGGI